MAGVERFELPTRGFGKPPNTLTKQILSVVKNRQVTLYTLKMTLFGGNEKIKKAT